MTPVERLVDYYENMSEKTAAQGLDGLYAVDAYFKDPFNEVRGVPAIADIFTHMYRQVDAPRFVVRARLVQAREAFLTWEFRFHMKRFVSGPQVIRGASHIQFNNDGLVITHRDYWDAAEELYEKLPVLGALMRWLKRRA
jgi:steroid delta-isomerase